jgi:threonine dehydratase
MESFQPTGAFKIRGALSALDAARRDDPSGAVITSSAGNHGLGIAHAAQLLGMRATVVVPTNASDAKIKKLRNYDIELIQAGTSYDEAQTRAKQLADERSLRFISPFNDTHVIAGQATVFFEMLQQAPEIEHVVISVGGGGLLSGFLLARRESDREDILVTGVQPERSAALYHVLRGVKMSDVFHQYTIADGLAGGGDEDSVTNDIVAEHKVPIVLVPEREIRAGIREAALRNGVILEGSASASYAAITSNLINDANRRVGFVACGRNIAEELLLEILRETD